MPTTGWLRWMAPVEPKKAASPKAKTPPSRATVQYPPPSDVPAIPTTGWLRRMAPVDPQKGRFP